MAFVESIAAAQAFTAEGEPEVDADQELRALGAANLAGGCFQAFPAGGGCPRRPSTGRRAPAASWPGS
jgi:sulfate permease, SulP family